MKKWRVLSLGVIFTLLLTGCGKGTAQSGNALALAIYPEMAPYPEMNGRDAGAYDEWWADRWVQRNQEVSYGEGFLTFAADSACELLADTEGENRVYSPINIYMALAMLAETTAGNTQEQILNALGEKTVKELRTQAKAMWNAHYNNDGAMTSILANSIWLSESMQYTQKTLDILAEDYYASSYVGEMGSDDFNRALQDWLTEQTGGLLEEQAQNMELDAETIIALASTVCFRAKWNGEFSKDRTKTGEFVPLGESGSISCDFMHQKLNSRYYWFEDFSAVAKPLQDAGQMWFFLPDERVAPEKLLKEKAVFELLENSDQWENSRYLIVNLAVPKFDVSSELDLIPGMESMGIKDVFSGESADFSPLTEALDGIFLQRVQHAVRVAIDEEGCAAAAYTVMVAPGDPMPPEEEVDFVLNRPFLFVITGWDGLPLFIGIVNTPY